MTPLVLLTDFGAQDGYVGIMKGIIAGIAPTTQVIDLSHQIPPQNLMAAKFVLWNSYRFFPPGSLFVVVVDPGVGSNRHILALEAGGYRFIAPDNGVLDYVLAESRVKHFLRVEEKKLMRSEISQTFHGRDIFAPVAAKIAAGYPFTTVGPAHPYKLPDSPWASSQELPIAGEIVYVDHFGNLISNVKARGLSSAWSVRI
ncbi:MAG: SAM-dependent chlorinase/fluorinase, partial [Bacteroidota bacterium]